jgi:hypothetical protein
MTDKNGIPIAISTINLTIISITNPRSNPEIELFFETNIGIRS